MTLAPGNSGMAVTTGGENRSLSLASSWNFYFRAREWQGGLWALCLGVKLGNWPISIIFHLFLSERGDSLGYSKKIAVPHHWKHAKENILVIKESCTRRKYPLLAIHLAQQQESCRGLRAVTWEGLVQIHPFLPADFDYFVRDSSSSNPKATWAEKVNLILLSCEWLQVFKILPFPAASPLLLADLHSLDFEN